MIPLDKSQSIHERLHNMLDTQPSLLTFTQIIQEQYGAERVYVYEKHLGKPYFFPAEPPYKDVFLNHINQKSTFIDSHICLYRLSDEGFLILEKPQNVVTPSDLLWIDTVWKSVNYYKDMRFLSLILDYSPDMIAYKDNQQIYHYLNKQARNQWPHLGSLIYKHVSEVYPESEVGRINQMDNVVYETKKPVQHITDIYSENGFITVETTRIPVIENDQIEGILTINKDITEIRKIEKELKRSYDFQDILIQIASLFINIPTEKADEAIYKSLGMVGTHINADRVYVFDYDFNQGITKNTYEWCAKDVEPMIEQLQNVPIKMIDAFWIDSHLQRQSVYIPDIEKLNHNSELFKTLAMQNIKSLLTIPLYDNQKVYGFVGFDAVKNHSTWTEAEQQLLKVLAEIIVNLKVRASQQTQLVLEKQNALKASTAKSEFLTNMSHEIRTPLSGIVNALYLLKNTHISEEQTDYLEIAKSSVESLSRIVNNILDLSKIEAGKLELKMSSFDLENELYQIIKMQEYVAVEKGIQLVFDYDYDILDEVITDKTRFRQIVLNLVSNAIKYTEQGRVTVRVRKLSQTQNTMDVHVEVIDTGIGIPRKSISKITDQFFQLDASITKKYPGTGLGLSIVKRLLEVYNSKLEIESEVGLGSTFGFKMSFTLGVRNPYQRLTKLKDKRFVILDPEDIHMINLKGFFSTIANAVDIRHLSDHNEPIYDFILIPKPFDSIESLDIKTIKKKFAQSLKTKVIHCSFDSVNYSKEELKAKHMDLGLSIPTTRERVHHLLSNATVSTVTKSFPTESIFKHKKVLVVDDNKVNRQAMQVILSKAGLDVILASSGIEAFERTQFMTIDIILMDIQMPEMDGYEAACKIRSLGGRYELIPIIAVTANATETANQKALASGMNDSIIKPFRPESLLELISKILKASKPAQKGQTDYLDFNKEALSKTYEHDYSLIRDILMTFMEDIPKQIVNLEEALLKKDLVQIEKIAHYLKGSTNYVFAEKAGLTCESLMSNARLNKEETMESLVHTLIIELNSVLILMEEYVHMWI